MHARQQSLRVALNTNVSLKTQSMANYVLIALYKAVLTHHHLAGAGSGDLLQHTGRRFVRLRDTVHWRADWTPYYSY